MPWPCTPSRAVSSPPQPHVGTRRTAAPSRAIAHGAQAANASPPSIAAPRSSGATWSNDPGRAVHEAIPITLGIISGRG